jgi:hypothetical protein
VHRRVPTAGHPHIYINMGEADTILCPYCDAVPLRSSIDTLDADPPDSFFADLQRDFVSKITGPRTPNRRRNSSPVQLASAGIVRLNRYIGFWCKF